MAPRVLEAIGLMSGTSLDGVDVALVRTDGEAHLRLGPTLFVPYADADRTLLRRALDDAAGLRDRNARPGCLGEAEACITMRHAEAVEAFLATHGLDRAAIDLVGFHGQTVLHRPGDRLTVQIGDAAGLAARLRLPVVHDFRGQDVAAGGEGAPLVPVFHRALVEAAGLGTPLALVNIGGVANVTYIASPDADPIACDTGPGNALLDDLMAARIGTALDRDGAQALAGRVDSTALAHLLEHPYFARPAPKSLDRNTFSRAPVDSLSTPDAAATLVAFTAESIARTLAILGPVRRVVVCGGGARNPAILRALAARTGGPVETAESIGWSVDFMEAQAFAYLAVRAQRGLPLTYPTTTGVAKPLAGGQLVRVEPLGVSSPGTD